MNDEKDIEDYRPVRTHIVSSDIPLGHAPSNRHHRDVTFRTIVLTAANPIRVLCAADLSREYLLVSAATNDVVLCENQSKAEDPANSVAGLPNPEGYLLKASATTAGANLSFDPVRLESTDLIWVTAASFPAQVSVLLVNCVD